MRKFITIVFSVFGMFCILYYCGKYFIEKHLYFEENTMLYFYLVMTVVIFGLVMSILNYKKIDKLQLQNNQLLDEVSHLCKIVEEFHYSEMESIKSNMECILDLDKGDD